MREIKVTADLNSPIVNGSSTPYAAEMRLIAEDLSTSLRQSLDAGDISYIEAAGRQALAAMLTLYAEGKMPEKQAIAFLKSLSEKKTPDPVQKVEQHNVVDMRVLLQEIVTSNPTAMRDAIETAKTAKEELLTQHQLQDANWALVKPAKGQPLSLPQVVSEADCPTDDATTQTGRTPSEPDELQNIRAGRSPQEGIDGYRRFSQGGRR